MLGAAIGGTLTRVKGVVCLRGLHGAFPWGPADGDWCSGGSHGPGLVYSNLTSCGSCPSGPDIYSKFGTLERNMGHKKRQRIESAHVLCKVLSQNALLAPARTARHAQSQAQKKGAGNQLKVEYIQRQWPPQIRTLYTLRWPVRADRGQRGACK